MDNLLLAWGREVQVMGVEGAQAAAVGDADEGEAGQVGEQALVVSRIIASPITFSSNSGSSIPFMASSISSITL